MQEDQYERKWAKGNKVFSIVALTHPTGVLVFGISIFALTIVAYGDIFSINQSLLMSFAMMFAQATSGIVNEIFDYDLDRVSKPWRALPAEYISIQQASLIAVTTLIVSMCLATCVSEESAILLFLGIGVGVLYSAVLKRTKFSWIPYVIAYPSLPLWVWISLGKYDLRMFTLYLLAFPFVIAFHIVNQLRDYEQDSASGVEGFVQNLGWERAVRLCFILLVISPLSFIIAGGFRSLLTLVGMCVTGVVHWLLVVPLIFLQQRSPEVENFRKIFRRLQVTGPLMMLLWLL